MIRVISIATAILIVLYLGVNMGYGRLEDWLQDHTFTVDQPRVSSSEKGGPTLLAGTKSIDYSVIEKRNIFSAALEEKKTTKAAPKVDPASLAPTSLSLTLLGTIAGGDANARAIIQDKKTKAQKLYQVGDVIENTNNSIIKEIERGKVVVRVQDRNEVLLLKEEKSASVPASVRPPVNVKASRPRPSSRNVRIEPRRRVPSSSKGTNNVRRPRKPRKR